jgi:predicted Ser/Thr protein kinase
MEATSDDFQDCSIQFQTYKIPVKIQSVHRSVHHGQEQFVYEATHGLCTLPNFLPGFLPTMIRNGLNNLLPRDWVLPRKIIIKPQYDGYTSAIEGEVYSRLLYLQGRLIPRYYGVWDFHHAGEIVRAHVIEQVDGAPVTDYTQEAWTQYEFKDKISQAYKYLARGCVIHGDIEARHILVTEQKTLILIDFDLAEISEDQKEAEKQNEVDLKVFYEKRNL